MQPPRVDDRDDTEDEDNAAVRDVGHCEEGMGMDREDGRDDDVGGGLRNEHKDMRSRRERDEVVQQHVSFNSLDTNPKIS